jgi:esterase/lipase
MLNAVSRKFWLVLLSGVVVTACSSNKGSRFELIEAYQFSDVTWSSYADYQAGLKKILEANWRALLVSDEDLPDESVAGGDERAIEKLVGLLAPTDNRPDAQCRFKDGKERGMLLIHGLYDSPYTMHDLEAYFRQKCFHTRSILLPGHGTRPASLLEIDFESWIKTVNFAIRELAEEGDDNVYLAGYSTGGALALNSAFENDLVKGVFLFAPALKVDAWAAHWLKKLGFDWVPFHRLADEDLMRYESLTLDSVVAVDSLANRLRTKLEDNKSTLTIPVFLVVAENDFTIKSDTAIEYFHRGRFGDDAEMFIYSPDKVSEGDPEKRLPTYINSRFVHQQNGSKFMIANYSHMALTLRPDDGHYGLQGDYKNCLQYVFDSDKRELCKDETLTYPDVCFGERALLGSQDYAQCDGRGQVVRRLTSNPQFEGLIAYLDGFIDRYID